MTSAQQMEQELQVQVAEVAMTSDERDDDVQGFYRTVGGGGGGARRPSFPSGPRGCRYIPFCEWVYPKPAW